MNVPPNWATAPKQSEGAAIQLPNEKIFCIKTIGVSLYELLILKSHYGRGFVQTFFKD
jgi:hypothetical protein